MKWVSTMKSPVQISVKTKIQGDFFPCVLDLVADRYPLKLVEVLQAGPDTTIINKIKYIYMNVLVMVNWTIFLLKTLNVGYSVFTSVCCMRCQTTSLMLTMHLSICIITGFYYHEWLNGDRNYTFADMQQKATYLGMQKLQCS